jgi:hypothetical protein
MTFDDILYISALTCTAMPTLRLVESESVSRMM